MRKLDVFPPKKSKYCPDNWKIATIHDVMKNNVKQQQTLGSQNLSVIKRPIETFFLELSLIKFFFQKEN